MMAHRYAFSSCQSRWAGVLPLHFQIRPWPLIFGTSAGGCPEAEIFLAMMRRGAAFCGIQILDYGLMANHFHLLCKVPEPRFLPESEVLERIEDRYGSQYVQKVRKELAQYADQPDGIEQSNRLLDRYRKR